MKTAIEVLKEAYNNKPKKYPSEEEFVIKAMQAYAEQAIDECLTFYVPDGNSQVWRDKILQVKKEL